MFHAPLQYRQLLSPRDAQARINRISFFAVCATAFILGLAPGVLDQLMTPMMVEPARLILLVGPVAWVAYWVWSQFEKEAVRKERLADLDPETALPHREAFVRDAKRTSEKRGVLLMLDIDHFDRINETGGSKIGKLCLMAMAQRFRETTRSTDVVGRLDASTFGVFLVGANVDQARGVAGRLARGLLITDSDHITRLTSSVGLVPVTGADDLELLLSDADEVLSMAKQRGRAKVAWEKIPAAA